MIKSLLKKAKMIIGSLLIFFLIALFVKLAYTPKTKGNDKSPLSTNSLGKGSQKRMPKRPKIMVPIKGAKTFPIIMKSSLRPTSEPVELENENRGRSEDFFLEYLWEYFPTYIYVDIALPINSKFFYPDFAFLDKKNNIFIDIEIDEPYAASNGYPTHFIGKDDKRNKVFLDKGWWIIRFTEEQIIRQPIRCCKIIAEVVSKRKKNHPIRDLFYGVPDLDILPKQWTKAQSQQFSKIKYRNNYKHLLKRKKRKPPR